MHRYGRRSSSILTLARITMNSRFVVISDTHFLAHGHRMVGRTWWNRVLEARSDEIGAALVETVNRLEADFVVHCGDFAGHSDPVNYEEGLRVMERLNCPWYAVPGNHDSWAPGLRAPLAARYGLPGEDCYYARDLAGMRFLFLDLAYWVAASGETFPYLDDELFDRGQILGMGPSPEELAWLEQELANARKPVALVSHPPLGYQSDYPMLTLPYGTPAAGPRTSVAEIMGDVVRRDRLRDLIRRCPQVKVAFAGHWHLNDTLQEDGITFCQTGSLREYPFEIRVVEVKDQHLHVTTLGLGEDFQRESYIAGWQNNWVAGADGSRSFDLDLT
jgi:predicted phosphodiesterase